MSKYPRLKEMGISEPEKITGYVINSIHRIDVLRVRQRREPGSLLPTGRRWEFPRIQQGPPDKQKGTVLTTSPVLREIEAELEDLLSDKRVKQTVAEMVNDELRALEDEVDMRIRHIRETLQKLKAD